MCVGACVHVCLCWKVGIKGTRDMQIWEWKTIDHMHDTQGTRMEYGSTGMRHWITSNHTIHTLPHTDTTEVRSLTLHLYAGGMWNKTEVFKQALSKWEKQDVISLSPSIAICEASHHHHPQITSHTNNHTSHTTHYSHHTKHTNLTYLAICRPDALPPTPL